MMQERLFENLGVGTPTCKDQHGDAYWVMTYSHKTQSFMKNGGQQKCLDKGLYVVKKILKLSQRRYF